MYSSVFSSPSDVDIAHLSNPAQVHFRASELRFKAMRGSVISSCHCSALSLDVLLLKLFFF